MDIVFSSGLLHSLILVARFILVVIVLMGVEGRVWFMCCVYGCLLWCFAYMQRL